MTRKTKTKARPAAEPKAAPLEITMRPLEALIPYARNAKKHPADQIAQLAGLIKEFGFTQPILVDGENGVVAGHGRLLAARKLGLAEVPVIELAHLSGPRKRAYIIADNKVAEQGGWDFELLREDLNELDAENIDMELTGIAAADLENLMTWAPPGAGDGGKGSGSGAGESGPREQWHVLIECADERQQTELLERFSDEGLKCKALVS